ncbi:MAG TPA: 2'-5' RNA ligase family protein [Sphingobacteriaceae bacterium]
MKSLYLVAILPPEDLSYQIDEIRKECSERYHVYKALKPPVHITLYRPVWMEDSNEKQFSLLMKQVGSEVDPFTQEIENFGAFAMQVVYINALKNPGLLDLRSRITSVFRNHKIDPKVTNGNSAFNPHFTIAYRDVLPDVFQKIWDEYKNRKFKRQFRVYEFSLLKHDGKRWNLLENFSLQKASTPSLF